MNPRILSALIFTLLLLPGFPELEADVRGCTCDVAKPETMAARECSLCAEAEKAPASAPVVLVKDINPRKPNRWLVLPRKHYPAGHPLAAMPLADRTALWTAAIEKGKALWGNDWGAAMNGDLARTQCHGHVHVGKMLEDIEYSGGITVDSPAQIPVPSDGSGIWVHQLGNRLHVHTGETITETVLMR